MKTTNGKYFHDEIEYTLEFEGKGIKVLIDKSLSNAFITDMDMNVITKLYAWESGCLAFIGVEYELKTK